MKKIRLRVSGRIMKVDKSIRKYENISISPSEFNYAGIDDFAMNWNNLKSLKLYLCHFQNFSNQMDFVRMLAPNLIELELKDVAFRQRVKENDWAMYAIEFPKLQTLVTSDTFACNIKCTTLKHLDISHDANFYNSKLTNLFCSNPHIEHLTITYNVIEFIWMPDMIDIHLNLKSLHLKASHNRIRWNIDDNINFQRFLKTQAHCIESVTLEIFKCQSVQYIVQILEIIFEHFRSIRKLVISNRLGLFYQKDFDVVTLTQNLNIVDLQFRFDNPFADNFARMIIPACPNVKRLLIRESDQQLFEFISEHMKHVEFMFGFLFKASILPHPNIKFKKLRNVKFMDCSIDNHPKIKCLTQIEQKQCILKLLR
jgi:hypothetical protein